VPRTSHPRRNYRTISRRSATCRPNLKSCPAYADQIYDKWANPILANGQRLCGELFHDQTVQKILAQGGKLNLFTAWVKYPRTYHLPWSENITEDDRVIDSLDPFREKQVIVTVKMDGENSTLYQDYCHARSVDSRHHPSRDWLKNFWNTIRMDIPKGWRICGENLFATHSIHYTDLPSYFLGFSIWDDQNNCLSWEETLQWFDLINIHPVESIYTGIFEEKTIRGLWNADTAASTEGYVLRSANSFHSSEFQHKVAKFVRQDHVRTVTHWMSGQRIEPNVLATRPKLTVSSFNPPGLQSCRGFFPSTPPS
jgi:hypothetical protein